MTDINPELIECVNRARMENLRGKPLADHEYKALRSQVEVDALSAALSAVAPLFAAQALEDARDAGATELLKLLIAEDDAQYIGGSSQGMGPIEAYETVEGWLDSRTTKLREGAEPDPLDHSAERCGWKSLMLHGPDVSCELPRGHIGSCSFDQPPSPDPLNEDDFHNWADTLDRTPTIRHRDAITDEMVERGAAEARAWGVKSSHGGWSDEETQRSCARDILEAAIRPETTIRETRKP